MIAVDTNVLVYAHRSDSSRHEPAEAELFRLADGAEPWAVPVFCLAEFLRVVTHPRIFGRPSSVEEACGALRALVATASARVLSPGPRFPALFVDSVREADARGNLVFDAQIAALLREHGVREILSFDRDFERFPGLRLIVPGAG